MEQPALLKNITNTIGSAGKGTPASHHHGGGGFVPLPIVYPIFPFWGYGWGGGYGGRYQVKENLKRRQERLYDKYGIETENFDEYRRHHGGSGAATSLLVGAVVGLAAFAMVAAVATTAFLGFGLFYGLVAGFIGGSIHSGIRFRKDISNYDNYLDKEEARGRQLQAGKAPAKERDEPSQAIALQKEKAIAAMPGEDMAFFDTVGSAQRGTVSMQVNEQLQQRAAEQQPAQEAALSRRT